MAANELIDNMKLWQRQHPIRKVVAWLSLFTCLAAIILFVDWVLRTDTLPVHEVSFQGEFVHVTRDDLEQAIAGRVFDNYLIMSLADIRKGVENIPWIYKASVRRKWPAGVHVNFIEQDIVARWGQSAWLNRFGEQVTLDRVSTEYQTLPVLHGPDGTSSIVLNAYNRFQRLVDVAGLKIDRLVYNKRRSWKVTTSNGIEIFLGRYEPDKHLDRLANVYPVSLTAVERRIKRIDLRYTNGFAVAWDKPGGRKMSDNQNRVPDKG